MAVTLSNPAIEWPPEVDRMLLDLSEQGVELKEIRLRIHAAGFPLYAYPTLAKHRRNDLGWVKYRQFVWEPSTIDLALRMVGLYPACRIADAVELRCGRRPTDGHLARLFANEGVSVMEAPEGYSMVQAADELGISPRTLSMFVKRHNLRPRGNGRCRYLDEKHMIILRERYTLREGVVYVSPEEAGDRLGWTPGKVLKECRRGLLDAVMLGGEKFGTWFVPLTSVERIKKGECPF